MISSAITSLEPVLHHSMQQRLLYKNNFVKLLLAFLVLALAVTIYILDRSGHSILFLQWIPFHTNSNLYFGLLGETFPSFAHTYALILITSTLTSFDVKTTIASWFSIECFFELIQSEIISSQIMAIFADSDSPLLILTRNYCVNGTFDWLDIIAIALGALLAYFSITYPEKPNLRRTIYPTPR